MEIVIFWVNATIPVDSKIGKYPVSFDVSSDDCRVTNRIRRAVAGGKFIGNDFVDPASG